jgi:cardiolipin synthase A/B
MDWPLIVSIIVYLCGWAICLLCLLMIPRRRDPGSAQAWLLFIFLFPWLGLLMFLVLGSPKLPPHRRARQRQIDERLAQLIQRDEANPTLRPVFDHEVDAQRQPIATLVERLGGLPVLDGNSVELLPEYNAAIDRIVADIDQASAFVNLLMYIFADDAIGQRVADALGRACARGVRCRVLVDSVGSGGYLRRLLPRLRGAGIEVRPVLPFRMVGKGFTRPDLRNHRKIVVVDGQVGYTGSQNVVDSLFKPGVVYEELVARVRGPIVAELQAAFMIDWYSETDEELAESAEPRRDVPLIPIGDVDAQVLPSGPAYETDNVPLLLTTLLYAARTRAVITTPYFIPDAALLTAIASAARRGVDVHLVVSAQGDQFLVSRAQRSYYEEMLDAGVKIHAVPAPALVHAKHLSIDDDIVMIGSSNMDVRSFRLNLEITLLVYDRTVNAALRAIEQRYFARATQLSLAEWQRRPWRQQLVENTSRLVSNVL